MRIMALNTVMARKLATGSTPSTSKRFIALCFASLIILLLACVPAARSHVGCLVFRLLRPFFVLFSDEDPLARSMIQTTLCILPGANLAFATCRAVPEPLRKVGWEEFAELVDIQCSWATGALDQTSEDTETVLRLHSVMRKIHTASQYLNSSTTHFYPTNDSMGLLDVNGNATLHVLDLVQEMSTVASTVEYTHHVSLKLMHGLRTLASSSVGGVLYPSERWLAARLFQSVMAELRGSLFHVAIASMGTTDALLLHLDHLPPLEEHASRLCWPRPLGRAGSFRKILQPQGLDDIRCRDLTLGLELARFDVEGLLTSARKIYTATIESSRQLSALEERIATQEPAAPDTQETGWIVAGIPWHMRRVGSAKTDPKVMQLLRALVSG
ncbi:uncharacterized protein C8Q71DRAFT_854374 [Rhodofomes roseus]|uniref:Uncharacterized protein n=1 Tax=Rhodofomes roseus TaxID=34475 RepID=A0ABQ8KUQ6_9APHY|nr:uncharacterized protein C8Q71DRAFT_854374 [Rhodofomes roseus]KAH9842022.1 hypothetical protein C8Q71DRAFT_854374 [Rhodofomes roseus]